MQKEMTCITFNINKIVKKVLDSKYSTYRISKITTVDQATISNLRNNRYSPKNLRSKTAQKLINFFNEYLRKGSDKHARKD